MKTKTNKRGFTLVELLVVITIIGILAGLAIPGVTGVLDKANQMADVSNSKQTGLVLFVIANDESGVYPIGGMNDQMTARTEVGTSTLLFTQLIVEGALNDARILATKGKQKYLGRMGTGATELRDTNVGWDYVSGLDTSSLPRLPLLVSYGAYSSASEFGSVKANLSQQSAWKDKGVVIFTVGQSAEFVKAIGGKVRALVDSTDVSDLGTGIRYLKP